MAIAANEIKRYLSGGGSNNLPSASLGGARSSTEVSSAALFNLFDRTSSAEALAGDTEYRCYYLRNESSTDTWLDVKVYIQSNTPSADTAYEVGIGTAGKNATEQTIADEETAPTGVTFSAAANEGAALDIGDLAPNDYIAIWLKRVVNATASAVTSDPVTLRFFGDHPA